MDGVYPVFLDGQLEGKLRVSSAGAMTEFEAECHMHEGIVRLSVYGGGREGYLGVMVPGEGGLVLRKKLSRSAMRNFPEEIELAERSGMDMSGTERETGEEAEAQAGEPQPQETECEAKEAGPKPAEYDETDAAPRESGELDIDDDTCWYSSPDGVLVCFDGEHSLVAFPVGDARIPEGRAGSRRAIEGREYIVYITKNGRIVS